MSAGAPTPPAGGYPLGAIVGQDDLVEALLVCAVNPAVGGVLVRGERGTAKSTAVRALAPMLGAAAPLIEVPLGATLDRLIGALDVRAALGGEHRVEQGLLARADGGVLYVDEVNLLGDHLVDALLDAAAAGRVVVERDGISVSESARFLLVGTMNPEEGELRPQLLDRFGLGVEVAGPRDPRTRAEIVRRRMAYDADPAAFRAAWAPADAAIAERLRAARERLAAVDLDDRMLERITAVCARLELDGVRGDLICAQTARALAALDGAAAVDEHHVARAAHLALRHRMRRDPLAPPPAPGTRDTAIDDALDEATDAPERPAEQPAGAASDPYDARQPDQTSEAGGETGPQGGDGAPRPGSTDGAGPRGTSPDHSGSGMANRSRRAFSHARTDEGEGVSWAPSPDLVPPPARASTEPADAAGDSPAPRSARPAAVPSRIPADALLLTRRSCAPQLGARRTDRPIAAGRARGGNLAVVDARPAREGDTIAALPTLLAGLRGEPTAMSAVTGGGRAADLLIVVDASGSMAARRRLARVKGAVEGALRIAYARRDRVTVVAFAGGGAQTIVPPGAPLEVAAAAVAQLPAGGRTPLAAGLEHAAALLGASSASPGVTQAGRLPDDGRARLVLLLTDGRAADPEGRAARALAQIRRATERTVVVDLEDGRARLGLAAELAARAGADLTRLVSPGQAAPTHRRVA